MFDETVEEVNENLSIHIIDVKILSPDLKKYLDEYFVDICEGDSGSDLGKVKKIVLDFLKTKNPNTQMGATAEFFLHLYLKYIGFKQECLFLNLEERSIKKGFDGYYSIGDEEFIMESKSGLSLTDKISHKKKIKEAYEDLKNNLAGTSKKAKRDEDGEQRANNPWKNAYNHASHVDVGTAKNIRANIKKLSDDYDESKFYDIKDFNIIPASTIFLDDTWTNVYSDNIIKKLEILSDSFDFNKINIICLTKKSLKILKNYLEE